ncbi:hypothetical protein H9P43_006444, partial [Blastocladiella emersonii ATCC 22665]
MMFMADLGAYTLEKTGFDIKWAEKPIVAPCAIPEPEEEEEEKTPTQLISEFIVDEFKTLGYVKDSEYIYKPSAKNPFYFERHMTVDEYVSYILDDVFVDYYNQDASKYRRHVTQRLAQCSKNIPQYKQNRSLIAFKNGVLFTGTHENRKWGPISLQDIEDNYEWFVNHVCSGNPVVWTYIDNEFDFDYLNKYSELSLGPYQDVLDLQFGSNELAKIQYVMMYFGRTMFPVGYFDNWAITPFTYGESGTGKSLSIKLVQDIHGMHRFQATASDETVTKFTIAYTKNKVAWELTDVNADFFEKLGFQTAKNLVEGKGLSSARKGGDEVTDAFEAHMLPTSNFVLKITEVFNEVSKRFMFINFTKKPERENTFLQAQSRDKYLLNILLFALDAYHFTVQHLEENQRLTFRDDIMEQAMLYTDFLRALDLHPKTKWNDSLMEARGLGKATMNLCKYCMGKHAKDCCT